MSNTATYMVLAVNVAKLEHGFEKLNRRAAKLGLDAITMTIGETVNTPVSETQPDGSTHKYFVKKTNVTITGQSPTLEGWTLAAVLQHVEGATIIRGVPCFKGEIPTPYRSASADHCDHCKTSRRRIDTFVISHDDGRFAQIGRQCLRDFLGNKDPHALAALAALAELWLKIEALAHDDGGYGGELKDRSVSLEDFLANAAAVVRVDGWMSRTKARDTLKVATADLAIQLMFPSSQNLKDGVWKAWAKERQPTEADRLEVAAALEYVATIAAKSDLGDYEYNLVTVCSLPVIDFRMCGIAASLISAFKRFNGEELRRQNMANSQHFGTVGEKVFFKAKIIDVKAIEGQYGTTFLYTFLTEEGNVAKWFASNGIQDRYGADGVLVTGDEAEQAMRANVTIFHGTIKKHDDYRGLNQTVLTRVTDVSPEAYAKEVEKAERKAQRAARKAKKEAA